jgi:hypothetical protein
MSGVVDPAMREAKRQAGLAGLAEAAKFTQSGAFGGARNILAGAERERNLATQLSDIYGKGQQEAFLNAQQQFERDQARKAAAQQFNINRGLEAESLKDKSKQFEADLGLKTASTSARYLQEARELQQRAEEAQLRGDQFGAELALNQLKEANRAAEATRAFESQQERNEYLDPYRELMYAQSLLTGLPTSAGSNLGANPSLAALIALLGGQQALFSTTPAPAPAPTTPAKPS